MTKHRPRHHLTAKPEARFCQGKRRYGSRQEAELVQMEQELLVRDLNLSVYRCSIGCGGWHLTRRQDDNSTL